jgi:hypothetical protein
MNLRQTKERPTYKRSGRVAWLRFVPCGLGTLLVAGGMGWCWFLVAGAGWGYWIVTAAVLALPVALTGYLAVALGHCRNSWVAGTLAFFAAVVFHAAYFHADFVRQLGPQAFWRIELLPKFIAGRMAVAAVLANNRILPGGEAVSWFYASTELLVVFLILAGAAIYRSRRGYCESCHRWMRFILFRTDPGTSEQIAHALESDLSAIPVTVGRGMMAAPAASVEFEYCPGLREPGGKCEAYLTLQEFPGGKEQPKVLLYQGRLQPDELVALADRVAALGWLRVSAPPTTAGEEFSARSIAGHVGRTVALERLPPDAGATALDRAGKVELLLGLASVAVPLVGIGLIIWGVLWAPWAGPPAANWSGWLLLAAGLAAALVGGVLCWVNIDYLGMRYSYRSVCGIIGNRPDALVAAGDLAACWVDIVPRVQWHQLDPTKPAERGLLLIDLGHRRLLFEGMKERYVIPADAVRTCAVEPILPHAGAWNLFAVVLTVRYAVGAATSLIGGRRDDEWEIPLVCRPTEFRRYSTAYRRALAESLLAVIEELLPQRSAM